MSESEPGGRSAEPRSICVTIDENSRFFAGHFPGRPILPAIAHLMLVDELLRQSFGQDAYIRSIERLRIARPVLPGDLLEISLDPLDPNPAPSARFTISRGGAPISDGVLNWAREAS